MASLFEQIVNNAQANTEMGSQQATQSLATNALTRAAEAANAQPQEPQVNPVANILLSGVEGLKDIGTGVAKAPFHLLASTEGNVPEDIRAAFYRRQQGNATPEDLELLKKVDEEALGWSRVDQLEQIQGAKDIVKTIDDVTDLSWMKSAENVDQITRELRNVGRDVEAQWDIGKKQLEEGDYFNGLTNTAEAVAKGIFGGIKTGASNPQAVLELVAEEVPELAAMALGGTAGKIAGVLTSGSEAMDTRQESIDVLQKEKGRALTEEELSKIDKLTAGYFTMDYLADIVGADRIADVGKKLKAGEKLTVKDAALNNLMTAVSEGVSEAGQEAIGAEMQDKKISFEDLYTSGALGAIVGSTLSGAGDVTVATQDVVSTAAEAANKAAEKQAQADAPKVKVAEAVKIAKETKEPVKAMEAVSVARNTREAVAVANDIAKDKEAPVETVQAANAEMEKRISEETAKVADIENRMQEAFESGDMELGTQLLEEHSKAAGELDKLRLKAKAVNEAATLQPEQIDTEITNVSNGDTNAATRIYGSFKANPDSISTTQLETLSTNQAIPEVERKQYEAVAKVRRAMNTLEGTESEVLEGGYNQEYKRYMSGLKDYERMILNGQADTGIKELERFTTRHVAKADFFEQKLQESQTTGKQVEFRYGDQEYFVNAKAPKSVELVQKLRNEANVLNESLESFKAVDWNAPTETVTPEPVDVVTPSDVEIETSSTPVEAVTPSPEPVETAPTEPTVSEGVEVEPTQAEDTTVESVRSEALETLTQENIQAEQQYQAGVQERATQAEQLRNSVGSVKVQGSKNTYTVTADNRVINDATGQPVTNEKTKGAIIKQADKQRALVESTVAPEQVEGYSLTKDMISDKPESNLVAQWFEAGSKETALETKNNFFKRLATDTVGTLEDIYGKGNVTAQIAETANNFIKFHDKFVGSLDNVFIERTKAGAKEGSEAYDFAQYLAVDGKLPENVKTAMAVSAYDWTIANAFDSTKATEESVKATLGLGENDYYDPTLYNLVGAGKTMASVKNSLATGIRPLLNLKLKPDANMEAEDKLTGALGSWAFVAMKEAGLLKVRDGAKFRAVKDVYISGAIKRDMNVPEAINDLPDAGQFTMVVAENFKEFLDGNKSSSFTNKVFGAEREKAMPSFEPPKATMKVTKSTQKTSYRQRKLLEKEQARPAKLNKAVANTFFDFDEDLQKEMLGYVPESELENVIEARRGGVEGKNRQIEKDLDTTKRWKEELEAQPNGLDTLFYYTHTVWRQGRMGIANAFNPQASKVMRYFQGKASWERKVEFGTDSENWFLLAVAEGFDIVSDKQSDQDSINDFRALLQGNPEKPETMAKARVIRTGINGMREILKGNNTPENQRTVTDAVKSGGMGMKTYQVITAYAEYLNARERGDSTFTHSLAREVDGITNGVFITTLQFAKDNLKELFRMLNRMGVFGKTDELKDFVSFNKAGNQDSYKTLAADWHKETMKFLAANPKLREPYLALQSLFGEMVNDKGEVTKEGRNLAKNPLMTFIYGASFGTILNNMANNGIENLYDSLQKAYDAKDLNMANQELAKFGRVIGKSIQVRNMQQLKKFKLDKRDVKAFQGQTRNIYKDGLEAALRKDFGTTIDARDKFTAAINLAHRIYAEAYNTRVKELMDAKQDMPAQLRQLTVAEHKALLEELRPYEPVINTAISYMSADPNKDNTQLMYESGLVLGGTERLPRKNEKGLFDTSTKVDIRYKSGGKNVTSSYHYLVNSLKAPGAAGLPMTTQSIDAATQLFFMNYVDGLNVHDAEYMGEKDFGKNTQQYNRVHLGIHKKFTMAEEFSRMTKRIVENAKTNPELWSKVLKTDEYKNTLDTVGGEAFVEVLESMALDFKMNKEKAISNIESFAQYRNGDNSALVLTDEVDVVAQNARTMHAINQEVRNNTQPTPSPNGALFSSTYEGEFENIDFDSTTAINNMNTLDTFEFLKDNSIIKDSEQHTEHLKNVISGVINKVIEPFNLYTATSEDVPTKGMTNGSDMYIVNQIHGVNTPSGVLAAMGNMSASEVFVHEMVHNVSQQSLQDNQFLRDQVTKLWNQAKKVIKPEHFLPDGIEPTDATYDDEMKIAQDKWEHIFKIRQDAVVNGKRVSNHLHEFVAMGITNEKFREALSKIPFTDLKRTRGKTLSAQLLYAWELMLDAVNAFINGTRKADAATQLDALFRSLANVDGKNKAKIRNLVNQATKPVKVAGRMVKPQVDMVKEGFDQALGKPIKFATKVTVDGLVKGYREKFLTSENILAEGIVNLVEEASGRTAFNGKQHDLRRKGQKTIDQMRENLTITISNVLRSKFSREVTVEEEKAMMFGLGKTDASVIKEALGYEGLKTVFSNTTYLNNQIARVKAELQKFPERAFYITQAENLGNFMVTGKSYLSNGLLNAEAISILATEAQTAERPQEAKPLIDLLASLYAVKKMNAKDKAVMNQLFNSEDAGVSFAVDILAQYRKESAKEFADNPLNLIKGYMKDIIDPNMAVEIGTIEDKSRLEKLGFTMGSALPKDRTDVGETKYIFINPYGNHAKFLQGNIYLNTKGRKGSAVEDFMDMADKKAENAASEYTGGINPRNRVNTIPVIDKDGNITGYRYIMNEATRDNYLKREPSFFGAIGAMHGELAAKAAIPAQNRKVIDAIKAQFNQDYKGNEDQYVEISPRSLNARYREIYAMLPKEARDYAKQVFGGAIKVRKDQLNLLFGYRKLRLADSFFKDKENMNALEAVIVPALAKVFGSTKAARSIFLAQDAVEEMVKFTKDIIVVKSGIVTLGNTASNVFQLWMSGVPMSYVAKHYTNSFEALRKYKRFDERLGQVDKLLLDTSLTPRQRAKLEEEKLQLESELAENPIGELIDEGVLPNIVEDMTNRPEDFSIKSAVAKKLKGAETYNRAMARMPESMKNLTRELFMTQDSEVYKILNGFAQFSDFGARAVRYKYLVENGMDKQVAIGKVMDEYINYDLPTGRYLQFMNDIGILWFSKYLIRVQKTIAQMFLEHPARVLSILLAQGLTGVDLPTTLGSFAQDPTSRLGDPISATGNAISDFTPLGVFL
ncbi:virion-encapsulated RNA polymerase [Vibrio phage PhiImVa-1]|nr:virion-encapsulated RNA polymerase [Vibrio phage PhiImVa-1]